MLAEGKYKVLNIVDAGLTGDESKVQPYIRFEIQTQEGPKEITWFGNLNGSTPEKKEKAEEITVKSLVTAGFIGNDFDDLNKPHQIVFNQKELDVVVKHDTYNGKTSAKVAFINERKGLTEFTGAAPSRSKLFAKIKSELGVKDSAPSF